MRINRVARTYRIPKKTDREIKRLARLNRCSEADVIAAAVGTNGRTSDDIRARARILAAAGVGKEPLPQVERWVKLAPYSTDRVIGRLHVKTKGPKRRLVQLRPVERSAERDSALDLAIKEKRPVDFAEPTKGMRRAYPNGTVEVL